jgi:hypothetical protein
VTASKFRKPGICEKRPGSGGPENTFRKVKIYTSQNQMPGQKSISIIQNGSNFRIRHLDFRNRLIQNFKSN